MRRRTATVRPGAIAAMTRTVARVASGLGFATAGVRQAPPYDPEGQRHEADLAQRMVRHYRAGQIPTSGNVANELSDRVLHAAYDNAPRKIPGSWGLHPSWTPWVRAWTRIHGYVNTALRGGLPVRPGTPGPPPVPPPSRNPFASHRRQFRRSGGPQRTDYAGPVWIRGVQMEFEGDHRRQFRRSGGRQGAASGGNVATMICYEWSRDGTWCKRWG